jgi:PAS domain S-box-containing protein
MKKKGKISKDKLPDTAKKRKKAEKTVQHSEERFQNILENIQEGYFEVDLAGNFTFFNDTVCRALGYPKEKLMGTNNRLYTDKEELERVFEAYNKVYKTGEPNREFCQQIIRKDGTKRYIEGSISLLKDSSDKPIGFRGILRDITERKKADEALRKSEELYHLLAEHMTDIVWIMDMNLTVLWLSPSAMKARGFSVEEIKTLPLERQLTPDSLRKAFDWLGKWTRLEKDGLITESDGIFSRELEFYCKDGHIIVLDCTFQFLRDEQGKATGILAEGRDVTARKRAEERLRNSEEKFRMLAESSAFAIMMHQGDLWIYANRAAEQISDYTEEELCGMHFWDIVHPDYRDMVKQTGHNRQQGKVLPRAYEFKIITKNGVEKWVSLTGNPIRYEDKPTALISVTDITERKRADEELIRVNRALRMLSDTNQALIRIADEMTLLNEVCRVTVEVGGYRMAWIGLAQNDEAKTVRPVVHAGFESGYVESANLTWADNERGRGPGGIAIRTGQPCINRNIPLDPAFAPWREAAIQHGYKSNIALPLISEGQTFGVLEIYSVNTDAFDAKEVEILKEMAGDLAFGINALRTRVKRKQTEVALGESEERYRLIAENTADTIAVFDLNLNPTYVSPSILKLGGYTVQEAMTKTLNQILTPDSLQKASKIFADQMALESSPTADPARTVLMELEQYCKDGSCIWVELAASFLRDNNFKPKGILTITRDITERKKADAKLKLTLDSLRRAVGTTIQVLVSAVESRDTYTSGHQSRSADLACVIATEIGLDQDKIEGIHMAGIIHDIGKLSIPAEILSKPTKLTDLQFSLIKQHSRSGYEMLKNVESPWPLAEIVYQHHERLDGSGYPRNLKGDEILIEARIMAVADVVEAMASHRPYRPTLGIEAALEEIEKNKGILYDKTVADACLKLFREKGYQLK